MIVTYLKIAIRSLRRNTTFSFINIFGLALGLAVCLLITLFVTDELAYDRYNEKADRIFRIHAHIKLNNNSFNAVTVPAPLGPSLVKDYPQIETMVRLLQFKNSDLLVKNETIQEHRTVYADSTLFDIFSIPFIAGNPKTALVHPRSLVITEGMAKKYFNRVDVAGETLLINNSVNYKITGVIKDMPSQSHFHFDFIRPMSELDLSGDNNNWLGNNFITYVVARKGVTEKIINTFLQQSVKNYLEAGLQQVLHTSLKDLKNGDYFSYKAMPLTKIHLRSNLSFEIEANGDVQYVYIFIVVAVFILLLACVNFINLSTARLAGRSKEVGIRKVLGSSRTHLILQFLTESVATTFIALLLALLITGLLLPYFNQISGKTITLDLIPLKYIVLITGSSIILVGVLAGSYPAFYMSAFKPISVLKGKIATGFKSGWLRNSLLVFQFATAIILIIGTIVIYSQLHFMRNKKPGYNRDQVLILHNTYSLGNHAKKFKEEVSKLPGVEKVTMTKCLPTSTLNDITGINKAPTIRASEALIMGYWHIDADYIPAMGMQIAIGRNFSPLLPTDSSTVLINETAAKMLEFDNPLNKKIYLDGRGEPVAFTIVGVVKDFNAGSLRNKIEPIVFHLAEERGAVALRVNTKNLQTLLAQIKKKYEATTNMADMPFTYSFMDTDFNNLFQTEQRTGKIFSSFATLAILIASLGLFGLITYAAEQRVKEIGIRKVLGATMNNIIQLMAKDFLKLVLLAAIIAFPIAWWIMNKWLENFAYRTHISWWIFSIAGAVAVLIAVITVSFQAIKAAVMNPVNALRSE